MAITAEQVDIIVNAKVDKAIQDFKKMDTGTNRLVKGFKKLVGPLAIGAVITAAIKMGKAFVDAYTVQEQAQTALQSSIIATGRAGSISLKGMEDFASGLQDVTLYGDEVTLSAQSVLQSLADLDEKGLKQITPGVQDFATAMGVDLKTAMSLVGKTLGSSTNALSRYGISIDMTKGKTEKLQELTKQLKDKFGGMAKAAANTATGGIIQLNNSIGDLKEQLGRSIADGMKPFAEATENIVKKLTKWIKADNDIKEAIKAQKEGTANANQELIVMNEQLTDQVLNLANLKTAMDAGITGAKTAYNNQLKYVKNLKTEIGLKAKSIALDQQGAKYKSKEAGIDAENAKAQAKADAVSLTAAKELQKINYDNLSSDEQKLKGLQDEIDKWAKKRDEVGKTADIQKLLNTLISERNDLQKKVNDDQQKTLATTLQINDATKLKNAEIKDGLDYEVDTIPKIKDEYKSLASDGLGAFATAFKDMGEGNKTFWESVKSGAKDAISAILEGLAKQALIQAAIAAVELNVPKALGYGAAAAAAYAASGYVQSLATGGSFTTTGPTPILVGDNASGQERVTVEPTGGSSSGGTMILNIDGRQFTGWLQDQLNNGMIRVPRRVVV